MNTLRYIRYLLEIISVPIFFFLVVHMAGHGMMLFFEENHTDGELIEALSGFELSLFFNPEVIMGVLLALLFVWVWHRRALKHLVPCAHEHCHESHMGIHVLAIVALCLHFFPEAALRREFLNNIETSSVYISIALIGFLSHFIVDIIVAIVISTYWEKLQHQILSFICIATVWITSWIFSARLSLGMSGFSEGIFMLLGALLLAMFIHKPHKPVVHCHDC